MSGKHLQHPNQDVTSPGRAVLFIEQKPESFKRANVRAITSHARRWQTKRKHQELRIDAQREAVYARGLVGWQNRKASQPALDLDVVTPANSETQHETERPEEMPWQISGGLRSDPFDSLPSPKSKEVMQMVDYCGLLLRRTSPKLIQLQMYIFGHASRQLPWTLCSAAIHS